LNILLFEEAEADKPLSCRDPRAVHLVKILRKARGDVFDAGVLGGKRGKGKIERIAEDGSIFFSLELDETAPRRLPLHIGVGFLRPIQMQRILRDLSSMGVGAISVFGTDLGEKSYRDTNFFDDGGACAALRAGASQSRDTTLPALTRCLNVDEWLLSLSPEQCRIFADNVKGEGAVTALQHGIASAVVAVGSERGWSDRERAIFKEAHFQRLSLGSRALRTETACIAATALVSARLGKREKG
jgi:RsmE family RNA methyltransferase